MPCAHFLFLIWQVLYSDSFRKQVQGKAAYVLDTPEMRRVRETQKHISTVRALIGVLLAWQVIEIKTFFPRRSGIGSSRTMYIYQVLLTKFLNAKGKSHCRKGMFGIRLSLIVPWIGES